MKYDALVGDTNAPMRITLGMNLTPEEVQRTMTLLPQLAQLRVRNLLGNAGADELALVQYLSSPQGKAQYQKAVRDLEASVQQLQASPSITLGLELEAQTATIRGTHLFHQEVAQIIARSIPPSLGDLTYFPADRAMPSGEVNIQIGSADATAQLHSHLGSPANKYQRLKQHIVNQSLTDAREAMQEDFAIVFNELLTGKQLDTLGISQDGMLTVRIREPETNAVFDIDNMSSGEKGLLLTFFLMKRSTAGGGIILLDEPELHLNPAVAGKIVSFLREQVLEPLGIQALICTHSPEMTARAYDDSDCTLLHLRTNTDITPIRSRDRGQVYEALKRLGSGYGDVLFSRGSIYVEGEHDADLLSDGWPELVAGYKITQLGGRGEVEKSIRTFQDAEQDGKLDTPHCFIFDLDGKPTSLADTPLVKVQQWDRHCLENYLLDADIIFDVSHANNFKNIPTRGGLATMLRDKSLTQLQGVIAREIYQDLEPGNPGFRPAVLAGAPEYADIAQALLTRLLSIRDELSGIEADTWAREYADRCQALEWERLPQWRDKWKAVANGKLVLKDVYNQLGPRISLLDFKRRIVSEMRSQKPESWRTVDSVLRSSLER